MGVNSLPKTVSRQHRDCDLNLGPFAPESSTLTTRLPSHPCFSPHSAVCNVPMCGCRSCERCWWSVSQQLGGQLLACRRRCAGCSHCFWLASWVCNVASSPASDSGGPRRTVLGSRFSQPARTRRLVSLINDTILFFLPSSMIQGLATPWTYLIHLSLSSVILIVLSTSWCCPSRLCVVFLACVHLALDLILSLSLLSHKICKCVVLLSAVKCYLMLTVGCYAYLTWLPTPCHLLFHKFSCKLRMVCLS